MTLPAGGTPVDISYAAKVEANFADTTEGGAPMGYPDEPFFLSTFVDGFEPTVPPGACFIPTTSAPVCPTPLPDVWLLPKPYSFDADLVSIKVGQFGYDANTRVQDQGASPSNCRYISRGVQNVWVCDFIVATYCTPATSPPKTMYTPGIVSDWPRWAYWDTYAYCIHNPLTDNWSCFPAVYGNPNAFGLPAPQSPVACTVKPTN